jgi:Patatin phospholipase
MLREKHDVRHAINELHKLLPPDIANTEQAKRLYEYGCVTEMDIVQLIYRPIEPQGALKGFPVCSLDHGGAMATGALRCPDHFARLPMACTYAKGAWSSCVRRDPRNPRRTW